MHATIQHQLADASLVAQKLTSALQAQVPPGLLRPLEVSIAVRVFSEDTHTADEWYALADVELFEVRERRAKR